MPLNEDFSERELIINLSVPKEVKFKSLEFNDKRQKVSKTITLKKGLTNGQVVLDIKKVS